MRDIWIIAENPAWAAVMITGAKSVSADAKIVAFVNGDEAAAKEAAACGASSAFALPLPAAAMWEGYAKPIAEKAKADGPALIMASASRRGRDLAAQVAALLDAPLFTDGRNISVNGDAVTAETMVYGGTGNKIASATAKTVLVTVGAKDYEPAPNTGNAGDVAAMSPAAAPRVTDRRPRPAQTVNLGEAAKVVSVGRGFAAESELAAARELAAAIGAEVACSRPIAEFFKWMPEECYVGISGQVLKPDLYLAVGISGQAQHVFGVREAKTIVSVNKDAECPMNANADYYIVGDWKDVLPAIIKAAKG
ncbi:MAG: electron transfer flavoprotein subunit alpha/FixB family protein [Deltaproteobacteria bacterium]|jgi:electron transfer flavoprotein alpha subunit|nr:electron transfer flavoprotein subunit alpha/FixB family protein [Deltaproteobacteria bacterium]